MMADPLCTFFFSILVLCTTVPIMKDCLILLLEGAPSDDIKGKLLADLEKLPGVEKVHDLRLW